MIKLNQFKKLENQIKLKKIKRLKKTNLTI